MLIGLEIDLISMFSMDELLYIKQELVDIMGFDIQFMSCVERYELNNYFWTIRYTNF